MKKNVFLGILFDLLLSVAMLAISVWSTAQSSSFFLAQNDKYDIISASGIAGVDDYIRAYGFVTRSFAGEQIDSATSDFLWGESEVFYPAQLAGFKLQGQLVLATLVSENRFLLATTVN